MASKIIMLAENKVRRTAPPGYGCQGSAPVLIRFLDGEDYERAYVASTHAYVHER